MTYFRQALCHINGYDIEAAELVRQLVNMIIAFGNTFELALLTNIDEIFRLSARVLCSGLNLDKDKPLAIHGNNINFSYAAVMKTAFDDPVTERCDIITGLVFAAGSGSSTLFWCLYVHT